jgi:hypothetical protein
MGDADDRGWRRAVLRSGWNIAFFSLQDGDVVVSKGGR